MGEGPLGRISFIVVDAADPERLSEFWTAILGVEVEARVGHNEYVLLKPQYDGAPNLALQKVDDARSVKNRVHLDLDVADLDAARDRVVALGGSVKSDVQHLEGYTWQTFGDPEGNEFDLAPE